MNLNKTMASWETLRRPLDRVDRFLSQSDVLRYILRHAVQSQGQALVVFDLDCTLFDNAPREARILREFGQQQAIPQLQQCRPDQIKSWSLVDSMILCGVPQQLAQDVAPDLGVFWKERFFTDEYCKEDTAILGAASYVQQVYHAGSPILYCTGRPTAQMRQGTIESLAERGFPLPSQDRVELLTKPVFEMSDDDWKRALHSIIRERGPLLAAFDNEPDHINDYAAAFPEAIAVFVNTFHSGKAIPDPTLPSIQNFLIQEQP